MRLFYSVALCFLAIVVNAQLFESKSSLPKAIIHHQSIKTDDNTILVCGGSNGAYDNLGTDASLEIIYDNTYLYNISSDSWQETAKMNRSRKNFSVELIDNKVIAIGGTYAHDMESSFDDPLKDSTCELYDFSQKKWTYTEPLNYKRYGHKTIRISQHEILVVGGSSITDSCEILDTQTMKWRTIAPVGTFSNFTLMKRDNGNILFFGENTLGSSITEFNIVTEKWEDYTIDFTLKYDDVHFANLLSDTELLFSYEARFGFTRYNYVYNLNTGTLTEIPEMHESLVAPGIIKLSNHEFLYHGSGDVFNSGDTKSVQVYDSEKNEWWYPKTSITGLSYSRVHQISDNKYIFIGGMLSFFSSINSVYAINLDNLYPVGKEPEKEEPGDSGEPANPNALEDFNTVFKDKIYPNPAEDKLFVPEHVESVTFRNLNGTTVLETTEKQINISALKSGIYVLFLNTKNGDYSYKVIKQ